MQESTLHFQLMCSVAFNKHSQTSNQDYSHKGDERLKEIQFEVKIVRKLK